MMNSFIEQSLIFFGAAVVMVPLFHRLGLGSVLGFLIAGILVGPDGLRFIPDAESTLHFAEMGVVFLLFIIGLEIQPQKLWKMRKKLVGLGISQVVLCTIALSGVGLCFNLSLKSSLIMGFGLSLSSTAFALQNLMDRGEFNTEFGQSSFSILLTQDLIAIPALALIPALLHGGVKEDGMSLMYFPVVLIGLSLASRFLLKPIFRAVAKTRAREIFTAATLFIVLGVSAVMVKIGLSAALGAFVAGVLLADSEYRHELEANIEPFKGLLMGLFFMAVGMGVNLDIVSEMPVFIVTFSVAYFALKWAIIYGVGRIFGMTHEHSKHMGLSIAQGGEFAFVIFTMAGALKVLTPEHQAILTAVITISMGISPVMDMVMDFINDHKTKPEPDYDQIEGETPSVIVAGFGRFGQIFGRVLRSQQIPFVAIDHDSDHIESIRKFGNKVYYGDATREDLLISAGIRQAKYLVIAIDDIEGSLKLAKMVQEHFPHIEIFGRVRNRGHAFDYLELGVKHIKRETFDSSLNFAGELLVTLGYEKARAQEIVKRFRAHDEIMLKEQFKVRLDDKMFIDVSKRGIAQLEQVLNEDSQRSYIAGPEEHRISSQ